jgi:hypothetical protein
MDLTAQLDLGDLRLRALVQDDAKLLVEATRHEQARALWGPRPAGPYSLEDAKTALQQWDPAGGKQVSYGVLGAERLVAAVGLICRARTAPNSPTGYARSSGDAGSAFAACRP